MVGLTGNQETHSDWENPSKNAKEARDIWIKQSDSGDEYDKDNSWDWVPKFKLNYYLLVKVGTFC